MFEVGKVTLVMTGIAVVVGALTFGAGLLLSWLVDTEGASEEETADSEQRSQGKAAAYRLGLLVGLGLAVLTVIEYLVAVRLESNLLTYLLLLALLKAWLIVQYFMHLSQLWHEKGGH